MQISSRAELDDGHTRMARQKWGPDHRASFACDGEILFETEKVAEDESSEGDWVSASDDGGISNGSGSDEYDGAGSDKQELTEAELIERYS